VWAHPLNEQFVRRDGIEFPYHGLGLSLILALPVALGRTIGAGIGMAAALAGLITWLCALVGELGPVRSAWRYGIIGLFAAPAFLVSTTQIYPDLISGLLLAIALVMVASIETAEAPKGSRVILVGVLAGVLPWFHAQNLLYSLIVVVAVVVAGRRRALPWKGALGRSLVTVGALLASFVTYNLFVTGKPTGPGGADFSVNLLAVTRTVALIVDRQQGILIQLPVILLGISAIWVWRRRIPVTAISIALLAALVIAIGGSFSNSYGGASLLGRFEWTLGPVLLAFAGLFLLVLSQRRRPAFLAILGAVSLLYVGQALPILLRHHDYYFLGEALPTGNGWWGVLDPALPSFATFQSAWQSPALWWAIAALLCIAGLLVVLLAQLLRPRGHLTWGPLLGISALAAISVVGVALSRPQMVTSISFSGASLPHSAGTAFLGARVVVGQRADGAVVVFGPGWSTFPSGRYEASISYLLRDGDRRAAPYDAVLESGRAHAAIIRVARGYLPPSKDGMLRFDLPVRQGLGVFIRISWHGSGTLAVRSISLRQLSSSS